MFDVFTLLHKNMHTRMQHSMELACTQHRKHTAEHTGVPGLHGGHKPEIAGRPVATLTTGWICMSYHCPVDSIKIHKIKHCVQPPYPPPNQNTSSKHK